MFFVYFSISEGGQFDISAANAALAESTHASQMLLQRHENEGNTTNALLRRMYSPKIIFKR